MNDREVKEISEEFGRILVEQVRDRAIQSCYRTLQSKPETAMEKRWEAAKQDSPEAFAKTLIPDIVDDALGCLLIAIDQELLRLSFTAADGRVLDLTRVGTQFGEMSGSYGGGEGWCERFSKERFIDDFADLKHFFDEPSKDNEE